MQTRPVPEPGPGQLLVEVAASGVNFIDVYRRAGRLPGADRRSCSASECAGRVLAVGAEVTDFALGDVVATAAGDRHARHGRR